MPRPSLTHDGFLIPNAADVANPRMAEPDRIDFNTLAHARWGVVEGCLITVSNTTAMTLGGLAIVNGALVTVPGANVPLGVGGAQDRFDLLVVDAGGTLKVLIGAPANDPVFPDPALDVTVLAAVFAPAGTSNFSNNVIDKRKLLPKSLLTKIDPGDPLIFNKNEVGVHFQVSGGGESNWEGDTRLWRSAAETLSVWKNLTLAGGLQAAGSLTATALTTTGEINGSNLHNGNTAPSTGNPGDIWQNDVNGRIYVWRNNKWNELATIESAQPVGAIMTSIEPPSVMVPLGWVPFDGRTVTEADYPGLFNLASMQVYISGTAPNRTIKMPNADGRVLMTRWSGAGTIGGPANNLVGLALANMPQHKHNVAVGWAGSGPLTGRLGRSGTHAHPIAGGEHGHPVNDPGHQHRAMEAPNGGVGDVISLFWGGRNKIDALFNDRNHTYSVEPLQFTVPALTGISISSAGSAHGHIIYQDGDHDHPLSLDAAPNHLHALTEQDMGNGVPFDVTPSFLAVYTYLRS